MQEHLPDSDDFDGVVRLFPLPGLVFFPHSVQPLHIFEPRYRQMTADALAGDRLVSLVMLNDVNWDENYDGKPAIARVACLGKVIAEQMLPDGRYNLLLRGLCRVRIIEELSSDKLYRLARVEILKDEVPEDVAELMRLRNLLSEKMIPRFRDEQVRNQVRDLFKGELPLGHLCDVLSFALPMPQRLKQDLLETTSVVTRALMLLAGFHDILDSHPGDAPPPDRKFPPEFSSN